MRFLKRKKFWVSNSTLFFFTCLAVTIFINTGCNEPSPLTVQLPSSSESELNYLVSDTTSVYARTVPENPLESDEKPYALLGSYNDPVFGFSQAGFSTQLKRSAAAMTFGTGFTIDSAVLALSFKSYYGAAPGTQNVIILELNEPVATGNTYTSSVFFSVKPDAIAAQAISPQTTGTTVAIKMNNTFIAEIQDADTAVFADDAAFQAFFKGIVIITGSLFPASILYFDLLSSESKLTLWFHNSQSASLSYDFIIDNNCARVNHFYHNYSNTAVQNALNDVSVKQPSVYIQAMAGVKALLVFPFFDKWKELAPVSVANAELTVKISGESTSAQFIPPAKLFLASYVNDSTTQILYDVYEGESVFGGAYDSNTGQYTFTVSRYIQQKLNGDVNDLGLYLYVPNNNQVSGSASSANRVVIDAAKIRLKIIYTVL